MPLCVLIADDHDLVRGGIRLFLEDMEPSVNVIEAGSLTEALAKAKAAGSLQLVLLDLMMPGMDGFSGLEQMRDAAPGVPIVIVSGHYTRRDVLAAIGKGANGYIPKNLTGQAMVQALRLVLAGEIYIPSVVLADDGNGVDDGSAIPFDHPLRALSAREIDVLGLLVQGKANKQIANALGLQAMTVKIHLRNIYRKLSAMNRTDAVRIVLQNGWEELAAANIRPTKTNGLAGGKF